MRPRLCLAALLLALALTARGDTEPDQPRYRIDVSVDGPPAPTPPPTVQLRPDPDTGALAAHDIENAVRTLATADIATDGVKGTIENVRCLTGGLPLVFPTTALCDATIDSQGVTLTYTYGIRITDTQGHIAITRP